jgi:hypothetical protein
MTTGFRLSPVCRFLDMICFVGPVGASLKRATRPRYESGLLLLFFIPGSVSFIYKDNRVKDGLLKVTMVSHTGSERILAFLGPDAIVGEMSIIDQLPRSASVVAVRPTVLSFLSRADFKAFAKKNPQVYESLVTLLAARLRERDRYASSFPARAIPARAAASRCKSGSTMASINRGYASRLSTLAGSAA